MNKETKEKIRKDYAEVTGKVTQILMGKCPNGLIVDRDYLSPTVDNRHSVSLGNSSGAFTYYVGIRRALEKVLETGKMPPLLLPQRAPTYLSDLVA
jgi:hypothetical protein